MIIGLCGKKQAGKDTAAAYLIKEHGFERRAFADPLKRSVAALFDIPYEEVDKLKNDPNAIVALGKLAKHTVEPNKLKPVEMKSVTFREFIQRYGTESHRDVFGVDFWVDQTLPVAGYYTGRKIVVTDCRFRNEVFRVQELGGNVVKIARPQMGEHIDTHLSEDVDRLNNNFLINNNGTIEELYDELETLLEALAT